MSSSRLEAVNLLKLTNAAVVKSLNGNEDKKDCLNNAVASGNVFVNNYVNLLASSKYQKETKKVSLHTEINLDPSDFFPKRTKGPVISDEQAKLLVRPLKIKSDPNYFNPQLKSMLKSRQLPSENRETAQGKTDIKNQTSENTGKNNKFVYRSDESCAKKARLMPIIKSKNEERLQQKTIDEKSCAGSNQEVVSRKMPTRKKEYEQPKMNPTFKNEINYWLSKHERPKEKHSVVAQKNDVFYGESSKEKNPAKEVKTKNVPPPNEEVEQNDPSCHFKTARQQLQGQKLVSGLSKRYQSKPTTAYRPVESFLENQRDQEKNQKSNNNPVFNKYKNPLQQPREPQQNLQSKSEPESDDLIFEHPLLAGFDRAIIERVKREVVVDAMEVGWDDVAGLDKAKQLIKESVIFPILRPDLFVGLRAGAKAILLFGNPGTGKTMIGKCIASSVNATFMSISASTLTSKWIGESENIVRAMFAYARAVQPSVIFFDEIDSLLMKRSEENNETSTRLKTEFLVQMDGANTMKESDRVLLIGATNRPETIDPGLLRRFTRRILVPLPNIAGREKLLMSLLNKNNLHHNITNDQFREFAERLEGYSGADIDNVCREASMRSMREIMERSIITSIRADEISPVTFNDLVKASKKVKPTVSEESVKELDDWNKKFGFGAGHSSDSDSDSD